MARTRQVDNQRKQHSFNSICFIAIGKQNQYSASVWLQQCIACSFSLRLQQALTTFVLNKPNRLIFFIVHRGNDIQPIFLLTLLISIHLVPSHQLSPFSHPCDVTALGASSRNLSGKFWTQTKSNWYLKNDVWIRPNLTWTVRSHWVQTVMSSSSLKSLWKFSFQQTNRRNNLLAWFWVFWFQTLWVVNMSPR